ncbi:HAD-superfamily class IIA hydrolase, TIGR01459 [Tistlia consotensis]|uniref:HAD-superfamily class IIA hydrolase, TIGR01459 n=1 Tax=Tistlia consotensis USBA 355 TaxID=560819 RepID=A0A1Y6C1J5_9PROT|nr:TIGR01459 family HAD-type hydrolase [Tistlia consotensis]SMF39355.1 HAD-superfamily class IIA hydrolase, TIGR01459 [Tistlia consotensis USBA 355]SNR36441.1 HAD-superfamily class IIA hydrolase, TIGR01459 [Tistlia consotensis]
MDSALPPLPALDGVGAIAERYDGLICDLWGVLHDGHRAFPHAVDCLGHLRAAGKHVVILSNAPRRSAEIEAKMNELGIGPALYDKVISSGEEAWRHLKERPDDWYRALGRRGHHLGSDRDKGMREGLDVTWVEAFGEADFLLNTGAHMGQERVEDYEAQLAAAAALGLPMICANPDLEVIAGGVRQICAGALAKRYEELGGTVRYHGKPHREIYGACLSALDGVPSDRILAVGDSLRTDIAGAQTIGIDSLLVIGGIHAEELGVQEGEAPTPESLAALCGKAGIRPTASVPLFRW